MSSWFHRLRRKTAGPGPIASGGVDEPPAPPPCSPNRASYYVPSRDRDRAVPRRPAAAVREGNPKLRDTHFPPRSPQPSDIVFDVVAARRGDRSGAADAAPELKLRPILTKPPPRADADADANAGGGGGSSAAVSPTGRARPPPRFHCDAAKGVAPPDHHRRKAEQEACTRSGRRRRLRRRASRLRWVYDSLVVVKESADPEEDFLESMAEMIAANGVRSPRGLEELLACYLALNAADHHRAIVAAFRRAWLHLHLHRAPPPTPTPTPPVGLRCMHEHESCVVVD